MHNNGCFLKWTLTVTFCKEKRDDENYNDVFTSDDETLFKDTDIYAKRGNWPRYFSNIFSDQRFNGTQHEFTISVDLCGSSLTNQTYCRTAKHHQRTLFLPEVTDGI